MRGKRSTKITASLKPKKITGRQKAARKINIEVARRYKKRSQKQKSQKSEWKRKTAFWEKHII